jgi:hypothetical protein
MNIRYQALNHSDTFEAGDEIANHRPNEPERLWHWYSCREHSLVGKSVSDWLDWTRKGEIIYCARRPGTDNDSLEF